MNRAIRLIVVGVLWQGLALAQSAVDKDVTLYLSAFEGDGSLGQRTATVLNLQIWNTLRRAPFPNVGELDFGSGLIVWDKEPLAEQSHELAERMAADQGYEMVLWGKAWQLGDGVAVQPYLSFPDDPERLELWKTSIEVDGALFEFTLPIPRRRYELGAIVLPPDLVERYSVPSGLTIYAERSTQSAVLGQAGIEFRALEQGRDWARIRSPSEGPATTGWVSLTGLPDAKTQVTDFVAGMIRALRTDWDGAAELFENVLADPNVSSSLRVDALLYLGLARIKNGEAGTSELDQAREISPNSRMTILYGLMGRIEELAGGPDAARAAALVVEMTRIIEERRYVFPPADPWLTKAERLIEALGGPV